MGALLTACTTTSDDTTTTAPTTTTTAPTTTTTAPSTTTTSTASTAVQPDPDALPIIIDTDVSIDDVMAIPYLLRRSDVRILAVTVSGDGIAKCEAGVSVVLGLLAVSGADHIPVACGSNVPIEGSNAFPSGWRYGTDLMAASGVLPAGGPAAAGAAADVIAQVAHDSPVPPTVLLLGTHTNLAQALRDDPTLETALSGIFMMGGAINTAGNTFENLDAEWNLWIDPVAAAEVFDTELPVSIVPLDATNFVPLTRAFADLLSEHLTTPEAQAVYDLMMLNPAGLDGGMYFWDQLAAVALVERDTVTWHDLETTVLQGGGPDNTGTLAAGTGRPASVAMGADRMAFESEYLTTLTGEAVEASERPPDATLTISSDAWDYDGPDTVALGPLTVVVENQSEHSMVAVHGWFVGESTWEDLEAYTSIAQPSFLDVGAIAFSDPGVEAIWTIDFSVPGLNALVGLDLTTEQVAWRFPVTVEG